MAEYQKERETIAQIISLRCALYIARPFCSSWSLYLQCTTFSTCQTPTHPQKLCYNVSSSLRLSNIPSFRINHSFPCTPPELSLSIVMLSLFWNVFWLVKYVSVSAKRLCSLGESACVLFVFFSTPLPEPSTKSSCQIASHHSWVTVESQTPA